jgi:LmbE family N-acetylglucosaminyl deacetylase
MLYGLPMGGFFVVKIMSEIPKPKPFQQEQMRFVPSDKQMAVRTAIHLARCISEIGEDTSPKMIVAGGRMYPVDPLERSVIFILAKPQKILSEKRLLRVGAHDDDVVLGLLNPGYATITATLTDGSQRDPGRLFPEELRWKRIEEAAAAEELTEGALYANYGLPDTRLRERKYFNQAVNHLSALIAVTKPELVLAPHPDDEHPDHRAANAAARIAAGDLPFYAYDTPTMFGLDVKRRSKMMPVRFTHVYNITDGEALLRSEFMDKFGSQFTFPEVDAQITDPYISERADVRMVHELPRIRGQQWRVNHAGILLHQNGTDLLTRDHPGIIIAKGEDLSLAMAS